MCEVRWGRVAAAERPSYAVEIVCGRSGVTSSGAGRGGSGQLDHVDADVDDAHGKWGEGGVAAAPLCSVLLPPVLLPLLLLPPLLLLSCSEF